MSNRPSRWVGDVFDWVGATNTDPGSDLIPALSLNHTYIGTFDQVTRLLVDWTFHSQIEGAATGLEKQPEPWAVGVYYTPIPSADLDIQSSSVIDTLTGDALFSEVLHWVQTPIWDGTSLSYQWHAGSHGVRSQRAKRTIQDPTTALIHFGINPLKDFVPDETEMIPMTVKGLMRIKVLIEKF